MTITQITQSGLQRKLRKKGLRLGTWNGDDTLDVLRGDHRVARVTITPGGTPLYYPDCQPGSVHRTLRRSDFWT